MWPLASKRSWRYSSVDDTDETQDCELADMKSSISEPTRSPRHSFISVALVALMCLIAGLNVASIVQTHFSTRRLPKLEGPPSHSCRNPASRREWRSLSMPEKHDYLRAVQCLAHTPSRMTSNMTLYDDFPHVHDSVGAFCTYHKSAVK